MRTIRRTIVASALALPLSLGAVGIASADTGSAIDTGATSDAAVTSSVNSHDDGEFNGSLGLGLSLDALLSGNFESDNGDNDNNNDHYDNDGLLGGLLG